MSDETLNRKLDNILKDSLKAIYLDCPEIIECLNRVDFSRVNFKFRHELFKRLTKEEFEEVDALLRSDKYKRYKSAIDQAALACTQELGDLMYFVTSQNEQGDLN